MELQIAISEVSTGKIITEAVVKQGKDSVAKFLGKILQEGEKLSVWFEKNADYKRKERTEVEIYQEDLTPYQHVEKDTPIWTFFLTKLKGKSLLRDLIVNHPLDGKTVILTVMMINKKAKIGEKVEKVKLFFGIPKEVETPQEKQETPQESTSQVRILHGDTKPITTQELECPYYHTCMKITVNDIVIPAQHQKQIIISETTQKIPFEKEQESPDKKQESSAQDKPPEHICQKCGEKFPECGYAWATDGTGQQSCTGLKEKKVKKEGKKA